MVSLLGQLYLFKWLRRSLTEKKIQKIISSNSIGMRPNRCDLLLLLLLYSNLMELVVNTPHMPESKRRLSPPNLVQNATTLSLWDAAQACS